MMMNKLPLQTDILVLVAINYHCRRIDDIVVVKCVQFAFFEPGDTKKDRGAPGLSFRVERAGFTSLLVGDMMCLIYQCVCS